MVFFIACGGGGGSGNTDMVNTYKTENEYGYYGDLVLFADKLISGYWSEYRYDDNGSIQEGMTINYSYDNNGFRSMRMVVDQLGIDTGWNVLGEYGVDEDGSHLNFANGFYRYIKDIPDTNCIDVDYYTVSDVNGTNFSETIRMCKDY
jgi:hypothetical protein